MTCTCSAFSPFKWNTGEPSIFAGDSKFCVGAKSGKTQSQISSDSAAAYQLRTGRSLGTLVGISPAADKLAEESGYGRARKVAR